MPQFMVDNGWCYDRLTDTIVTPDMESRKALMERRSDCIVAMPGGCGTLEELLQAITRRQLGLYDGEIIIFNVAGYFNPLLAMLDSCVEHRFMHASHRALWQVRENDAWQPAGFHAGMTIFDMLTNPDGLPVLSGQWCAHASLNAVQGGTLKGELGLSPELAVEVEPFDPYDESQVDLTGIVNAGGGNG